MVQRHIGTFMAKKNCGDLAGMLYSRQMLRNRRLLIVPVFIIINVAVFIAWSQRDWLPFMLENFTISWDLLREGHAVNLLTSVFSHNYLIHIFINMFVLHSFGSVMEIVLGRRRFFFFYIVAGIVSSLSHCLVSAFLVGKPEMLAVGASGSISGLVVLFSLIFPREKILLFGLIPLPAFLGALAFIGLDIWGVSAQAQGGGLPIGHGAHLGGAFAGIIYYVFVLRHRLKRG
jgi:membrane associated rhomboid family serine protease